MAKLVDADSFLELGLLNTSDQQGAATKSPTDGLIGGVAKIEGRPVVIKAFDKTVFAATEGAVFMRKSKKLHEYAVKRGFPLITLAEGGGLRMPDGMGSDNISRFMMPYQLLHHDRKVPLITGIFGDSYGGPTWFAVSSDFVSQVKGTCMAVAGPRMLEVATGEQITPEQLGGWEMHATETGQIDHAAEDEDDCIRAIKEYLSYVPSHSGEQPAVVPSNDDADRLLHEATELVPTRMKRAYDMKKLIALIVDDHHFYELKEEFGKALITGFARLNGRTVGIIANQPMFFAGAAGAQECEKATDFIVQCDSFHIPLIFLHDIPGFRVSSGAERSRIPSKIILWNQALVHSTVPKLSVVIRKSIGAAYSNMCGPDMGGDFVVAWPTADINFTGPEVGINVVYGRELEDAEDPKAARQELLDTWAFESSPYKAASKHLIDDIIDSRYTGVSLSDS
ncbi:acyl-CoA carboxylase subunit beta [Geomicrobium sp. JCM 19038]|uniref:acyl-CoA carboxylase subunit beta n=1 Tax=Geomicrobium sp. JCM 19038 TaxID=1460635 RepID=UPI001EE69206|nr:carboxyl transferase domain-containing protein [Geomicrobium sp. JCM 19038]